MYDGQSTSMVYEHCACLGYDHNTCMYSDHSTCVSYDHNTYMICNHSHTCAMTIVLARAMDMFPMYHEHAHNSQYIHVPMKMVHTCTGMLLHACTMIMMYERTLIILHSRIMFIIHLPWSGPRKSGGGGGAGRRHGQGYILVGVGSGVVCPRKGTRIKTRY